MGEADVLSVVDLFAARIKHDETGVVGRQAVSHIVGLHQLELDVLHSALIQPRPRTFTRCRQIYTCKHLSLYSLHLVTMATPKVTLIRLEKFRIDNRSQGLNPYVQ